MAPVVRPSETTPLQGVAPPRHAFSVARQSSSTPAALNKSTNVILMYRMQELRMLSTVNFALAMAVLLFFGLQVALFVFNVMDRNDDDCGDPRDWAPARPRCGSPISDQAFHRTEFVASFFYACIEAFSLVYTPRAISSISSQPMLLRMVLFFDVAATFIPAVLVIANLEIFEVTVHEIEFLNELMMAFVNLVFFKSLLRRRRGGLDANAAWRAGALACVAPVVQLGVYNSPLERGEQYAHFIEFTFGAVAAFVTFWFTLDNWSAAEEELRCIKYGALESCAVCLPNHALKKSEIGGSSAHSSKVAAPCSMV